MYKSLVLVSKVLRIVIFQVIGVYPNDEDMIVEESVNDELNTPVTEHDINL